MLTTGLLLAAGAGSRLRGVAPYKPLCAVAGRALIDHALEGMAAAGLTRAVVSLGYGADAIAAHLVGRHWPLAVAVVMTDWQQPNGVSALAARDWVGQEGAVLAMCDHLVQPAHYRRLAEAGPGTGLTLGIDRRLGHPWVDPLDVTCVATADDRIVAIGKGLAPHDCYDTGVFAVGPRFFDALATLESPSLTEGVRRLAAEGRARIVDCSDLSWIDVDDAPAFAHAEDWVVRQAA
ncbi:nucleotidyltransferase [Sphingomonas sp. MA1305]|uniref:phosphocholine cytidylyltransferase family protein n=1 Tax=Sphingomonas sp. MA1305 TaxID=2479204 RepID=UPI0018DF8496|nr:NTP transferase domain-containing protein [Sphingomonas sp. MA1305]MBI0475247.1 nucleotidyltransferase [Sphingomonas sp. MA1305]